jgi:hypothetical protein
VTLRPALSDGLPFTGFSWKEQKGSSQTSNSALRDEIFSPFSLASQTGAGKSEAKHRYSPFIAHTYKQATAGQAGNRFRSLELNPAL